MYVENVRGVSSVSSVSSVSRMRSIHDKVQKVASNELLRLSHKLGRLWDAPPQPFL
jgi:hypothetical protein